MPTSSPPGCEEVTYQEILRGAQRWVSTSSATLNKQIEMLMARPRPIKQCESPDQLLVGFHLEAYFGQPKVCKILEHAVSHITSMRKHNSYTNMLEIHIN